MNKWTEALNCLVDPEHRARYWLQLIYDTYKERNADSGERIITLLDKMMEDVATASMPYIDNQIGQYNSKFVKFVDQYFRKNKLQKQNMDALIP